MIVHYPICYGSCLTSVLSFQEVSIFVFEKKIAEKVYKPKRRETVTELLRAGVKQLERLRHPRILQVSNQKGEPKLKINFRFHFVVYQGYRRQQVTQKAVRNV